MSAVLVPKHRQVDVRREGARVALLVDGREVLAGDWRQFDELIRALQTQARLAEEHEKRDGIVGDQAILMRLGVPVGLTRNPALLRQAANEAAWNTRLRRYIPLKRAGGIKSQTVFGTPGVVLGPAPDPSKE